MRTNSPHNKRALTPPARPYRPLAVRPEARPHATLARPREARPASEYPGPKGNRRGRITRGRGDRGRQREDTLRYLDSPKKCDGVRLRRGFPDVLLALLRQGDESLPRPLAKTLVSVRNGHAVCHSCPVNTFPRKKIAF